ncbi:MAG TPA: methyltransferase domain-containing protein [Pseudomonadales bacterium]
MSLRGRPARSQRLVVLLGILACAAPIATAAEAQAADAGAIDRAVNHPGRTRADLQRDRTSHPADVLRFAGVRPGMVVLDLLAGDGYYSELLARAVGPSGRVYLHNNQAYLGLLRRVPDRRRGTGMEALEIYVREMEDINLPSETVDLVMMVKVYHDLYYVNNGWNVPPGPILATLRRVLKPGGALVIVDHRAPDGTGHAFAQNRHRIAADFTREDLTARGFVFDGESQALANPADDRTGSPFARELRGRTDRFLHRYRKPAPADADSG